MSDDLRHAIGQELWIQRGFLETPYAPAREGFYRKADQIIAAIEPLVVSRSEYERQLGGAELTHDRLRVQRDEYRTRLATVEGIVGRLLDGWRAHLNPEVWLGKHWVKAFDDGCSEEWEPMTPDEHAWFNTRGAERGETNDGD